MVYDLWSDLSIEILLWVQFFRMVPICTGFFFRRMAAEYNLDLNDIPATGKDGRVLKEDVIVYMESKAQARAAAPVAAAPSKPAAAPVKSALPPAPKPAPPKPVLQPPKPVVVGEDRTEPLKGIMKAMTKTM